MQLLFSRSEAARIAKVSPSTVTLACRPGEPLEHACVARRLDLRHPDAVEWLKARGVDAYELTAHSGAAPSKGASGPDYESIDGVEDLTLRELCHRHGTKIQFKDWLDSYKKLVDIREKELKNEETARRLISRELVTKHLISYLDSLSLRLLRDTPSTIVSRVMAMSQSGDSPEACTRAVREILSEQVSDAQTKTARSIRKLGKS